MQILRKRMPWRPYLIRLTVLALIMALVGTYAMMRYRIGIDTQQERCLPDTTVYLIDLWNKSPLRMVCMPSTQKDLLRYITTVLVC